MAKKTMPQNVVKILATRIQDEIVTKRKQQNNKKFADVKKTPEFKQAESKLKELNSLYNNLKNLEEEFENLRDTCIDKYSDDTFHFGWNASLIRNRSGYYSSVTYVGEENGKPKSLAVLHEPHRGHDNSRLGIPTIEEISHKITLEDYFANEDMTHEEFISKIVAEYAK
jgi:hypothetical protein